MHAKGVAALLGLIVCTFMSSCADRPNDDALIGAIKSGDDQGAIALLRAGANPDSRFPEGVPALYFAVQERQLALVQALLKAGADVDASPTTLPGTTALGVAALLGEIGIAHLLIDAGANLEPQGPDLMRPIHIASAQGHVEMVKLLLEACADPDARAKDGVTPLHLAVAANEVDVVVALLKVANTGITWRGGTPLEWAGELGHHEVALQFYVGLFSGPWWDERDCKPN